MSDDLQIVSVADGDESPQKRAKQGALMQQEMLLAIQSAVANNFALHLAPVTQSLQVLHEGQAAQSVQIRDIESRQTELGRNMEDMMETQTKRMDALQAEIVELQKAEGSRPTSPVSPGSHAGFRAAPPPDDVSFDIVVGGWKEGCSRDSVLDQLNGVLSEALLSEKVLEIRLFGRRPTAGKVVLRFPPDLSVSEKRRQQMEVRDKLVSTMTAPLWCSIDKPPELRQVGKGVAMLAEFLSTKLGVAKQSLEVGSWTQAKFFLGKTG